MPSSEIELPSFLHRDRSSELCLNSAERIIAALLHGKTGLPVGQELILEKVQDAKVDAEDLAERLGMERKSEFTRDKVRAHKQRRKCLLALRREAKNILRDPEDSRVAAHGPGAQKVMDLIAKYLPELSSDSQPETSTAVGLLIAECERTGLAELVKETDLPRLYALLKQAQQRYVKLVKDEDADAGTKAEKAYPGADALTSGGKETVPPRLMREIKDSLAYHLRLVFDDVAYLARKGRDPYVRLLAQCREITTEANTVVKLRDTLAKKAEAKNGTATATIDGKKKSRQRAAGSSEGGDPATPAEKKVELAG